MVLIPSDPDAMQKLCTEDQLELLDSVDSLRSQGISHYVSLPQIIVCGDQSSGKSSVLEAISGVPFPARSTMCTRFPTEVVLRKAKKEGLSVSIVPAQNRSEDERASLARFSERLDGSEELAALIEKAQSAMGILPQGKAFARDILRVEVSGPDRPQLTIVDLPGLIHSPTKQQSALDVELVRSLVNEYMNERRSIILAVVSAKNDIANQIVLQLARSADKSGHRSLGVITKPDTLVPRSRSESAFVALARNQDVDFRLGWHVLKNLDTEQGVESLEVRDTQEEKFFAEGAWSTLPHTSLGIGHLRHRLSKVLLGQIGMELPSLIEEIEGKATQCRQRLNQLGQPRTSLREQKAYLLQCSQSFQSLVKASVDGTYNDPFFGDAQSDPGYRKRIRAVIQNLNTNFSDEMGREGHHWEILSELEDEDSSLPPTKIARDTYLEHVTTFMERTRGRELPGTFNPMVIVDLFYDQCSPWNKIVDSHVSAVWEAAKDFLKLVLFYVADQGTSSAVFQRLFDPKLEEIWSELQGKTNSLLAWHQKGHPITYPQYFTDTLQKVRNQRLGNKFRDVLRRQLNIEPDFLGSAYIDQTVNISTLVDALVLQSESDMEHLAASEASDCMEAYYKVALKRFIDDVAVEAVENILMHKLEKIFPPVWIFEIDDKDVQRIAGESEESRVYRESLTLQLDVLSKGLTTCKRYSAGRVTENKKDTIVLPLHPTRKPHDHISDKQGSVVQSTEQPKETGDFSVKWPQYLKFEKLDEAPPPIAALSGNDESEVLAPIRRKSNKKKAALASSNLYDSNGDH